MKRLLRELFAETLEDLSVERGLERHVELCGDVLEIGEAAFRLSSFERVRLVAIGKSAVPMARWLHRLLLPRPVTGVVVAPRAEDPALSGLTYYAGGHPEPTHGSLVAARALCDLARDARPTDFVVHLLSGGGSALCEFPIDDSLDQAAISGLHRVLVGSGADIVSMNVVRKHFSAIKGGRLAERFLPAHQVSLLVSDVPAGHPEAVASGPTLPDASRVADCRRILARFALFERLPAACRALLDGGLLPETPHPDDPIFARMTAHVILDSDAALEAAETAARLRGFVVVRDMDKDDTPVADAANHLLERLESLLQRHPGDRVAVITAGELSCPVLGDGVGGRNQAFVLECVPRIAGRPMCVLSAGTDGIDGNSPAAGAVADGASLERAKKDGLDPRAHALRSDAHSFFERLGDTLVTGPTGKNVRDLRILVAWPMGSRPEVW